MQVLVPLTAALVPLIITPGLLFHFDITPKVALLIYAVAALLVSLWAARPNLTPVLSTRSAKWFSVLLGLQVLWFTLATGFSVDPALSLDGSEWRRFGLYSFVAVALFTLFAVSWLRPEKNKRLFLLCSVISTILISAYVVVQYFGVDPLLPSAAYHAGEGPYTIVRP